jgi:DNA polymerase-3 subunit alpha (Gram-positive type)
MIERIELHCHTKMSEMDGIASVEELITHASNLGQRAIAITDHGVIQAFPKAYRFGKEHQIKIIYGVEVNLLKSEDRKDNYYHTVLLVKNMTGLKNLYRLISISHTDYLYRKPLLPKHRL